MSEFALPARYAELLLRLNAHLADGDAHGWLVGGAPRDLLLGRTSDDLDVAVDGDALHLARTFADATGGAWVLLDEDRGAARIVWPEAAAWGWPRMLDLARLRAPTLEGDLRGRDFTINALALPLEMAGRWDLAALIDPLGGVDDLRQRALRLCSPRSLHDDWLRMLRAVRFAAQLGFRITDGLDAELRALHSLIVGVPAERVRDEFLKLLALPHAGPWVRYLDEVRLLTAMIPELEPARECEQPVLHFLPVLGHLLEAVVAAEWLHGQLRLTAAGRDPEPRLHMQFSLLDSHLPAAVQANLSLIAALPYPERITTRLDELVDGVPRVALFKLAVLLHDVAKPQTRALKPDGGVSFYDHQTIGADVARSIARRLRLSRAACDYVGLVVREHMRPGQLNELGSALTPRAVYRFFRSTGDAGPDVLLHSLCDHLAMQGPLLRPEGWYEHVDWTARMLTQFYAEDETARPQPILRGDDLIRELDLVPGPAIGRLLEGVREAQAVGEIKTRDEALAWVRERAVGEQAAGGRR